MDDLRAVDPRLESADFAPVRVGGPGRRGGRSPVVAAGWVAVIAGVVAFGILGRSAAVGPIASLPSVAPGALGPASRSNVLGPRPVGPTRTSDPNTVALTLSSVGDGVGVTGTVLSRSVVWVFVSVQDGAGAVQAWRSLSVEDPDGGIRPSLQPAFSVSLPLPPSARAMNLLWVEVNAYNAIGRKIGSIRQLFGPGVLHDAIRIKTSLVR